MLDPANYLPVEGMPNHYFDVEARHMMVCREGQTPADLIAEMEEEAKNPQPVPVQVDPLDELRTRLAKIEAIPVVADALIGMADDIL